MATLLMSAAVTCQAADRGVYYDQGLLTVKLRGEPLATVLQQVQQRTGVVIKGAAGLMAPLARDIERLPLVPALRTLLDGSNFLLLEGSRASNTLLIVVAGTDRRGQTSPARAETASTAEIENDMRHDDPAVRIDAAERLTGRGDAHSLALLSQLLSDPSEAVRAVAQQGVNSRTSPPAKARRTP